MAEISTATVLQYREELRGAAIPFVEAGTFDLISDKWQLVELAKRLGVLTPKTHLVRDPESLRMLYPQLEFPVVLKPCRSRIYSEGRWTPASVKYAGSVRELEETVERYEYLRMHPFLIQEYISGRAHGIFALYDKGQPIAWFAHRRLRERPPSGGVAVLSESVNCNPAALRMARTLLDHVTWHGVAMVEFKVTREGAPYLMEVNGRFWGSLQLAVDAGVDFPWLLYQLATGSSLDEVKGYARGVRSRWLLGDLASLYRTLSGNRLPFCLPPAHKAKSVFQFLDLVDRRTRYEVNRWDDIKPFLFELSHCLGQ
ncbi:MAG TPA: ATP-grasp domain-containing protein [Terriglobia bacterium]|nr:ATP-grasp domain-containing protein [Terriglobia bacterium]